MSETKVIPVLPLRDIVVFPHMVVPLFVGRDKSVRALDEVMRGDKQILLATQKNSADDEPQPDRLAGPYLLFTASFDGPLDSYLDELCDELAAEALEIWGRCAGAPRPPAGAALKAYLRAHHHTTGFFVAAYPQATVGHVRAALAQRDDVIDFARAAQGMDPARLQAAFRERLGG